MFKSKGIESKMDGLRIILPGTREYSMVLIKVNKFQALMSPPPDGYCGKYCLEVAMNRKINVSELLEFERIYDNFTTIQMAMLCKKYNYGFALTENDPNNPINVKSISIYHYNEDVEKIVFCNLYKNHYYLYCMWSDMVKHKDMYKLDPKLKNIQYIPEEHSSDDNIGQDKNYSIDKNVNWSDVGKFKIEDIVDDNLAKNSVSEEPVELEPWKFTKKSIPLEKSATQLHEERRNRIKKWRKLSIDEDELLDQSSINDITSMYNEFISNVEDGKYAEIKTPIYTNIASYINSFRKLSKYLNENYNRKYIIQFYLKVRSNYFQILFLYSIYNKIIVKTDYEFPRIKGEVISNKTPDFIGSWQGDGVIMEFTVANKSIVAISNKRVGDNVKYRKEADLLGFKLFHIQMVLENDFDYFVKSVNSFMKIEHYQLSILSEFYKISKSDRTIIHDNFNELKPINLPDYISNTSYIYNKDRQLRSVYVYKVVSGDFYYTVVKETRNMIRSISSKIETLNEGKSKGKYKSSKSSQGEKHVIKVSMKQRRCMLITEKTGFLLKDMLDQIKMNEEFIFNFCRINPHEEYSSQDGIPVRIYKYMKKQYKLTDDNYTLNNLDVIIKKDGIIENYKDSNKISKLTIGAIETNLIKKYNEKQKDMVYKNKNSFKQFLVDMDNLIPGKIEETAATANYFKECSNDSLTSKLLNDYAHGRFATHLQIKNEHKEKFDDINTKLTDSRTLLNVCLKSITSKYDISFRELKKRMKDFTLCTDEDGIIYYELAYNNRSTGTTIKINVDEYTLMKGLSEKVNVHMKSLTNLVKKYSDTQKDSAVIVKCKKGDPNNIVNKSFSSWRLKGQGKLIEGWGNRELNSVGYNNTLREYFKELLELNVNRVPFMCIDTNQYTDMDHINVEKRHMLEGNSFLKYFTTNTKLSGMLEFNQLLFKYIYHQSIKADKSSHFYLDNLGYKNTIVIVRGGKSAMSTNNTKPYKLIVPISKPALHIMFGGESQVPLSYQLYSKENHVYLETPWMTQNISLCKTFMTSGYQFALSSSVLCQRTLNDTTLDDKTIIVNRYFSFYETYHNYRQTEGFLHNMRYVLFNMLSEFSDYESLIPGIMFYNYNSFQYFIQSRIIHNIRKIYLEINKIKDVNYRLNDLFDQIKINNVFTWLNIVDVTTFTEMFYTSFSMRKGYYNKKLEQSSNLHSVVNTMLDYDPKLANISTSLIDDKNKEIKIKEVRDNAENINAKHRHLDGHEVTNHTLSYCAKTISNCSAILQGLLLYKKDKDYYIQIFSKIIYRQLDEMANSNGLRGSKRFSDFFGSKGYDVVYNRLLDILKKRLNVTKLDTDNILQSYMTQPELFSYTFLDALESEELTEAVLHQVEKEQRGLGREIYVLDFKTKVYQQIIENYMDQICRLIDNEVISVPSSERQSLIHKKFIDTQNHYKNVETYVNCSLDCRKWAPGSNIDKYIDFINEMQTVLPKSFIDIFNYFFNIYRSNKKVYTRLYVIRDILKDTNKTEIANILIKDTDKADDSYYFYMDHSFMMGIFNKLSSLCHAANQMLASRIITTNNYNDGYMTHMVAIAHSDDSLMRMFTDTSSTYKIEMNLRRYEGALKLCNHLLSSKKCNTNYYFNKKQTGSNYLEFLSVLYIKNELIPMIPKFSANIEFNVTDAGYSSDMSTAISKCIELISNGGTFQEAYITLKIISSCIMKFYNLINNEKLTDEVFIKTRDMPYYFMGAMDCHPIFYIMMGSDAEIMRYLISDSNKINKIIEILSKMNLRIDVNESGLGLNWNFKHKKTLKLKKKIEQVPEVHDEKLSWLLRNTKFKGNALMNVLWYSNMLKNVNFANSIQQESELIKMKRVLTSINQRCIMTLTGDYTPREFIYIINDYLNGQNDTKISDYELNTETKSFYDVLINVLKTVYVKEISFYNKWNNSMKRAKNITDNVMTLKPTTVTIRNKNLSIPNWFNAVDYIILKRHQDLSILIENNRQKINICETLDKFFSLSNFKTDNLSDDQLKYLIQKVLSKNNKMYKIYTTRPSTSKFINDSKTMISWLSMNTYHHRIVDYKPFQDVIFDYNDRDWMQRSELYELCLTYNYINVMCREEGVVIYDDDIIFNHKLSELEMLNMNIDKDYNDNNLLNAKCLNDLKHYVDLFGLSLERGMLYDQTCYIIWLKEQKKYGYEWIGTGEVFIKDLEFQGILKFTTSGLSNLTSDYHGTYIFTSKFTDLLRASIMVNNKNITPDNAEYLPLETMFLGINMNNNICVDYRNNLTSIFCRVYEGMTPKYNLEDLYVTDQFKYRIKTADGDLSVNFPYESTIEKKYVLSKHLFLNHKFEGFNFLNKLLRQQGRNKLKIKDPADFYLNIDNTVLARTSRGMTNIKNEGESFYTLYLKNSQALGRSDVTVDEIRDNLHQGGLKYLLPNRLYAEIVIRDYYDRGEGKSNSVLYNEQVQMHNFKISNIVDIRDVMLINSYEMFFPKQCWVDVSVLRTDNYKEIFIKTMWSIFKKLNEKLQFLSSDRMYMYNMYIYHCQLTTFSWKNKFMNILRRDMKKCFESVTSDELKDLFHSHNFPIRYYDKYNISGYIVDSTAVDYLIDYLLIGNVTFKTSRKMKEEIQHNTNPDCLVFKLDSVIYTKDMYMELNDVCYHIFGKLGKPADSFMYQYKEDLSHLPWVILAEPDCFYDINTDKEYCQTHSNEDIMEYLEEGDDFVYGDNGDETIYLGIQYGDKGQSIYNYVSFSYNYFIFITDQYIPLDSGNIHVHSRYISNTGMFNGMYLYYRCSDKMDRDIQSRLVDYGYVFRKGEPDAIRIADYNDDGTISDKTVDIEEIYINYSRREKKIERRQNYQNENLKFLSNVLLEDNFLEEYMKSTETHNEVVDMFYDEFKDIRDKVSKRSDFLDRKDPVTMADVMRLLYDMTDNGMLGRVLGSIANMDNLKNTFEQSDKLHLYSEQNNIIIDDDSIMELEGFCTGLRDMLFKDGYYLSKDDRNSLKKRLSMYIKKLKIYIRQNNDYVRRKRDNNSKCNDYSKQLHAIQTNLNIFENLIELGNDPTKRGFSGYDKISLSMYKFNDVFDKLIIDMCGDLYESDEEDDDLSHISMSNFKLTYNY